MFSNNTHFPCILQSKKEKTTIVVFVNKLLHELKFRWGKYEIWGIDRERREDRRTKSPKASSEGPCQLGHSLGSPIIIAMQEPRNAYPLEVQAGQLSVEICCNDTKNPNIIPLLFKIQYNCILGKHYSATGFAPVFLTGVTMLFFSLMFL